MNEPTNNSIELYISASSGFVRASLQFPAQRVLGLVCLIHGESSNRCSPRNCELASLIRQNGIATCLVDRYTEDEIQGIYNNPSLNEQIRRIAVVISSCRTMEELNGLPIGILGSSTGAAIALKLAAQLGPSIVSALASRGGRVDMASNVYSILQCPLIHVVGELDAHFFHIADECSENVKVSSEIISIGGAGHLFTEGNTLLLAGHVIARWFKCQFASIHSEPVCWPSSYLPSYIIDLARQLVEAELEGSIINPTYDTSINSHDEKIETCVTIRVGKKVRGCCAASGITLSHSLAKAIHLSLNDKRFGDYSAELAFEKLSIGVWVLSRRDRVSVYGERVFQGLAGAEVRSGGRKVFYLPSVAVEHSLKDPQQVVERLARKGRLNTPSSEDSQYYETTWSHFVESPVGPVQLYGLLASRPRPCQVSAHDAASHLESIQLNTGDYQYKYTPLRHGFSMNGWTAVRSIGCTYALSYYLQYLTVELSGTWKSDFVPRLQKAVDCGLSYLNGQLVLTQLGLQFRPDDGLLGPMAIALLALSIGSPTCFETERRGLSSFLLRMQNVEGWFPSHISRPHCPGKQHFAPGQILLALASEPNVTDVDLFVAAERAYLCYRNPDRWVSGFFLAWQAKAWSAICNRLKLPKYQELTLLLGDALCKMQLHASVNDPLYGSFEGGIGSRKASFLVSLYSEAILAALLVARQTDDVVRQMRYQASAASGLAFLTRLQIRPEHSNLLENYGGTCGGFVERFGSLDMRCDYTMHSLTCLTRAIELEVVPYGID